MEHITNPTQRAVKRLTSEQNESSRNGPTEKGSSPQDSETKQRAIFVWDSMRLTYGARFQQTYGDVPNAIWLAAIAGLTDEECRVGFKALLRTKHDGWPPSLPEFMGLCRPKSAGVRFLGVPLTAEQMKNLLPPPDKLAKPEVIDGWIAKMRARFA